MRCKLASKSALLTMLWPSAVVCWRVGAFAVATETATASASPELASPGSDGPIDTVIDGRVTGAGRAGARVGFWRN
ncbi:hypothetical protein V8F33_013983 [Rhypophila sp. PSN 637]